MQFLHPWFLLGLGAAALPVIIHLVFTMRARVIDFPSLRFLRQVDRQVTRWRRIQELLLLLLRVLALLLLALALAGPVWKPSGGAAGSAGSAVALVLDDSCSMGLRDAEGTLFSRGRSLARAVLGTLRRGDAAAILAPARAPRMTRQPDDLVPELDSLEAGSGDGTLRPLVEAALKLLRETGAAQRELYVVSDFQRRAADLAGLDWRVPDLSVVAVPVSSPRRDNLTLEALEPLSPFATTSAPFRVRVAVANRGPEPAGRSLKIRVDDRVAAETMVFAGGGASTAATADLTFDKPGWQTVTADLDDDALAADNRRRLCVEVRPALRVLFVRPDAPGPLSRSFYLEKALNPGGTADTGVHATACDVRRLDEQDLAVYAVVFLVEAVPDEAGARQLRHFAANGGGIVIVVDPATEREAFNAALAADPGDGAPLSPARIAGTLGHERDPQSYQGLRDIDAQHPLFARLRRGATPIDWGAAVFFQVAQVEVTDRTASRVLARFTSGSPAVVEHRCGGGRVILVASSLHTDASTLPLKVGFVPFVHGLVACLAAPERAEGLRVGDRLRLQLPAAGAPPSAKLALSPKDVREAKAVVAGGTAAYDFGSSAAPGTATFEWLSANRIESRRVAINVNPEEGVLDYVEPLAGVPGVLRIRTADELAALVAKIRHGWPLTVPCLALALAAALVEALLANRFAFGAGRRAEAADVAAATDTAK
jgi:hypothetical protein